MSAERRGAAWPWWLALAPLLVAGLVATPMLVGWLPNGLLVLRIELATLVGMLGLLLSGLLLALVVTRRALTRHRQQAVAVVRQQASDERVRFLRRLDHELKNPLTAIRAGTANLLDGAGETDQRAALHSIQAQTLRLSRLVADLRKLADLEHQPLEREAVDLAALLREAVELIEEQPAAGERQLHLVLPQAPWPLPLIQGDRDLLLVALYNLLDNAVKYTRSGDTIEVRAVESDAQVIIDIADTGPGIPDEERPYIWDELYRGQGARSAPGSGLGLALVRLIAGRHRGEIAVRSRAGQGTVMTLRLPLI